MIKKLRNFIKELLEGKNLTAESNNALYRAGYNDALDCIEQWIDDKCDNNGWISVNDESLKRYVDEEILIYTPWGHIKKATYSVDDSPFTDDDGNEYQYSHWFSNEIGMFMYEFNEIKYWQPLPQPPEEN